MKLRTILGRITCPYCGKAEGMRVTPDKNGAPFGYCEDGCQGQLRVGGNAQRVSAFHRLYPHIKREGKADAPAPAPVTVTAPKAPPAPTPAPTPAPRKPGALDYFFAGGRP